MFKLIPSFNKVFVSLQDIKFSASDRGIKLNLLSVENQLIKNDLIFEKISFLKNKVFRNINFSYNNENYIFENLNLKIQKNKFIGIHGKSGSGKTTFINLLLRSTKTFERWDYCQRSKYLWFLKPISKYYFICASGYLLNWFWYKRKCITRREKI